MTPAQPISATQKRTDLRSLSVVVAHFIVVMSPILLAAALGPGWWILPLWFAFGLLMNGMLNLMHEAAHYHVFKRKGSNDILGHWILGPLALADFDSYRHRHWVHHRHLGEPEDPKLTYRLNIRGWRMLTHLLGCLLLVEAARKFRQQHRDLDEPAPGDTLRWFLRTVAVQAIMLMLLTGVAWLCHRHSGSLEAAQASIIAYLVVYVYGLGSMTVVAASIRAIVEHQPVRPGELTTGAAALRNFSCNPITRLCFGAYGFGEHATHHQKPALPYYQLGEATISLARQAPELAPRNGYISTLFTLVCYPVHSHERQ